MITDVRIIPTVYEIQGRIHRALVEYCGQLRPSRRTFYTAAEARIYRLRWLIRFDRIYFSHLSRRSYEKVY
jgi:hypothetical protein